MKVLNHLLPTFEQLAPLAQDPSGEPIAMLNLLRFRDRAEYPDGRPSDLSGREAYMRYVAAMQPIVEAAGGKFVFAGAVRGVVIGDVEDAWDAVGVVEYPSPAEFFRIATSPEVKAISVDREAGLAGQLLILTVADGLMPSPVGT